MKALLPLALMVAVAGAPGAASAKTLVSFAQSGGLAGVSMTVTVTTTGHVAVDGAGGNDRSQRLRTATLRHLRELLSARRSFTFDDAVAGTDRMTQAVTLFALLELYKSGELVWRQEENFGRIEIEAVES